MRNERIELPRVPEATRAVLDIGRRWLVPRGFRYLSSWRIRPMIAKATEWKYADVYLSDDGVTFAVVSPREQPRPGDVASIEFQSIFADGVVMSTFNRYRHAIVWEPPNWKIDDDCVADIAQALDNHRKRVRESGKAPLADPAERDRLIGEIAASFIDNLVAAGRATRLKGTEARMRFIPALQFAIRLFRGNMRVAKVQIVPLVSSAGAPDTPVQGSHDAGVAADMHSYFSRRALTASASGTGKWKIGAISAVAFIAVGAFLWDPAFALILLAVIAFHEGGHYLAMKAVGFRNLHVFFVPGLGGLATGDKDDASVAQKVFVYLAGPVPGIALATAGLIAIPGSVNVELPWMQQLLNVTLMLNLINLLPVTPLDGGRVLEVLLFLRWPRLRVAFTALSAFALIGVGALTGGTAMLAIGVLVALALPAQMRFSRLARAIDRASGEKLEEKPAAERVFTALASAPFAKWSYAHRAVAADELIGQLRTPLPGVLGVGAGLAFYAACFIAPLAAAWLSSPELRETAEMYSELRESMDAAAEEQKAHPAALKPDRDWAAELAQSRNARPERRLAVLNDMIEGGFIAGVGTGEEFKARRAEMRTIASTLPRGNVERVRALYMLLDEEQENVDRYQSDVRALLDELAGTGPEEARLRARLGVTLASTLNPSKERLDLLTRSRDTLRDNPKPGETQLGLAWGEVARELGQEGNVAAADTEWLAMMKWYEGAPADDALSRMYRDMARRGYSTSLLRQSRYDDAEAFIRPAGEELASRVAEGKRLPSRVRGWETQDLLWIAIRKGDAAQASTWVDLLAKYPGAQRSPEYQLGKLAVADLKHDEKAVEETRKRISGQQVLQFGLCKHASARYEGTEIATKRAAVISRYRLCAGGV